MSHSRVKVDSLWSEKVDKVRRLIIEELMAHYAENSTRDCSHLQYYGVLGCYKLGLILEGTYARACAGQAAKATGDRLHRSCIKLFQRALGWLERGKVG